MKLIGAFQRIELKRAMKILPQYYLGAVLLTAVLVLAVVCGSVLTEKEEAQTELSVALVMNNNTYLTNFGMEVLESSASAGSLCNFVMTDEESAKAGLKDRTYCGIIIFPNYFISSALYEEDGEAAVLYLPRFGNAFNNGLLEGLATAASGMLSATEAGLSAAEKVALHFGASENAVKRVALDLENGFGEYALSREECFVEDMASGTGGQSPIQYYFCAGIVLLLLLGGVSCGPLLKGDSRAFENQLYLHRIGPVLLMSIRYVAVLALFGTLYTTIFAILGVFLATKPDLFYELFVITNLPELLTWYLGGIPMLLLAAAMVCFVYAFAGNQIGGILLLFVATVVMGYASGCLAPAAYLPKAVRVLGGYLPTAYMLETVLCGLKQMLDWGLMLRLLLMAGAFFAGAVGIQAMRRRAGA